jgi:hypothetical protein
MIAVFPVDSFPVIVKLLGSFVGCKKGKKKRKKKRNEIKRATVDREGREYRRGKINGVESRRVYVSRLLVSCCGG